MAWRFTNLPHWLISTQVFLMFPFFTVLKGAGLFRVSDEVEDEGLDMSKHGGAAYEIDVRARRPPFNVPQRECKLMCRACGQTPTPTQLHLRHACGTLARERARAGGDAP